MIDTIAIKHAFRWLDEPGLASLGAKYHCGRRNPTWSLNQNSKSYLPRITISKTPDAYYHVYAECSIPRLLYGHNAILPVSESEVRRGMTEMCTLVESTLDLDFDIVGAKISRIHLARDYRVGDAADRATIALYDRRLQGFPVRTLTADTGANTLYFNGRSPKRNLVICIYPKHSEVLAKKGPETALEAANGNLRVEYRANTIAGIKSLCNRFGAQDIDDLVTRSFNNRVFELLETDLRLNSPMCRSKSPLELLLERYSQQKAQRLFGFLEMRRIKGDSTLVKTDREKRNFNSSRRDCERAGVWLDPLTS